MQPRNQFNSYKSADGDQQLALTTSAKRRSCSLRSQFNSGKSADGHQQLALTTTAKSRSCSLGINSTQEVSRWRLVARIDDLSQKQVMQPGNQFNSGKSADGDQQLALTTSSKSRSCSLGINSTQASQPMEINNSH